METAIATTQVLDKHGKINYYREDIQSTLKWIEKNMRKKPDKKLAYGVTASFLSIIHAIEMIIKIEHEISEAKSNIKFVGIDSREVAQTIGKSHAHLMRDIQKYVQTLNNSIESKNGLNEFFIENTYKDGIGRTLPCYLLTRKGCEFVANKMTGEKGIKFTAEYINRFHDMEKTLQSSAKEHVPVIDRKQTAPSVEDIKVLNAKTRLSNQYLKLSKLTALSQEEKDSYARKAAEVLEEYQ